MQPSVRASRAAHHSACACANERTSSFALSDISSSSQMTPMLRLVSDVVGMSSECCNCFHPSEYKRKERDRTSDFHS